MREHIKSSKPKTDKKRQKKLFKSKANHMREQNKSSKPKKGEKKEDIKNLFNPGR